MFRFNKYLGALLLAAVNQREISPKREAAIVTHSLT